MPFDGAALELLADYVQQYNDALIAEIEAKKTKAECREWILSLLKQNHERVVNVAGFKVEASVTTRRTLPVKLVIERYPEAAALFQERDSIVLRVTPQR